MDTVDKAKRTGLLTGNIAAAEMDEASQADVCPTCGAAKKAEMAHDEEMGPEQGGSHGMKAKMTGTDFPGYRQRKMKRGDKVSGAY